MTDTKNILIIGRTGSGKSTLANLLFGKEGTFKESNSSVSETKDIQSEEVDINGVMYRIIDTVGIGCTKLTDEEIACKMFESCHDFENGLTQILFIIDGRFTQEEIKFYNIVRKKILDKDVTKYTTIVRTKFFNFRSEDKYKNDHELLKKENPKIAKLINSCDEVIYVDNPSLNSSDYDEEEIILHKKRRKAGRDILLNRLNNCQGVYKPENLELINQVYKDYYSKFEGEDQKKFVQFLKGKIGELKNKGFFKKNKQKLKEKFSSKKPETGEETKGLPLEAVIEVNKICKQM